MLTQIANIIIPYRNIIYFCYKLQKIYNSICVFATKNLCGAQSYNAEKSPADSLCGGLLYYIIYPALLLRMRYEINQRYNSRRNRCTDDDVVHQNDSSDSGCNAEHCREDYRNPHGG